MTARRGPVRHGAEDDVPFAVMLREGRGHREYYARFAPPLYRYCWSLLGPSSTALPDAPGEATREALVASVELLPLLRDRAQLRPWLFALARTSCQRRGFAPVSPYAGLATVEAERPLVETMLRIPPSHRELLELYLRHGLSPSQIALILGLDAETAGELCRAAARRAIEVLSEHAPRPARPGAGPWALVDVADLMRLLVPPGPPEGLRERVIAACTAVGRAEERRGAAALMRPLGPDGFPLHRDRALAGGSAPVPEESPQRPDETTSVAADRITTFDVTGRHAAEPVAELAPDAAPRPSAERGPGTRWLTPIFAGLSTVVIALALWMAGTLLGEGPTTVTGTPPSAPGISTRSSAGVSNSAVPDRLPAPGNNGAGADEVTVGAATVAPPPVSPAASPAPMGTSPAPESSLPATGGGTEPAPSGGGTAGEALPRAPQPSEPPSDAPGRPEEGQDGSDDLVSRWLEDLLGLLGPRG
ncbi:DNA-directed RNA polymerase specialized sigma subunit, sigma24 family [Marinactinospora thermotolerans DSM 45154]|uniref:DNA-directed RNA polymerase specialized sigma subunit, sigma24 family n=1 Tax=Marinactinospora thermotolerans DSM 45154 TaxID=1122192 RepID=A0A1T4SDU6_9ACTN|nr:sigma-70 family RNA polymerase sigma factor [Marinactinospora thermotolerans]SKA26392.1 DNA-directed RNA polymerase specialized sigma subunit, sigma24 family [Marinactinospora thermotolerans DSM 45154]